MKVMIDGVIYEPRQPKIEYASGATCPDCRSKRASMIISTRYGKNNEVRRRRECLLCDRRWTTLEIMA